MATHLGDDMMRTTYNIDNGQLTSVVDPDGQKTELSFLDGGLLADVKYPDGSGLSYEYSRSGKVVKESRSNGGSTAYDISETGVATQTTALNRKKTVETEETTEYVKKTITNSAGGKTVHINFFNESSITHSPNGLWRYQEFGLHPLYLTKKVAIAYCFG